MSFDATGEDGQAPGYASTSEHLRFARMQERVTPYSVWALALLILANIFNYVDRTVISIVATSIQRDLHVSDAQLGFLMGTAFATLFGMFGIGMGRIADALSRTRLMAVGIAIWSAMTVVSGLAVNFIMMAIARIGVGIGEATATPCSHALLSDYFPARNRSAVLGMYLIGAPLGIAMALALGGFIVENWTGICVSLPVNACAVSDWQATFFIVGVPGLVLALLIATLYEPRPRTRAQSVTKVVSRELSTAIPPFTFFNIYREAGMRGLSANLGMFGGLILAAVVLSLATDDWAQWIAIAIGSYSVLTWGQVLRHRDRPLYVLTFGSATVRLFLFGGAMTGMMSVTVSTWAAPYAIRVLEAPPAQVGFFLAAASIASAVVAAVAGGVITDYWKQRDPRAPIWMALVSLIGPAVPLAAMLYASDLIIFTISFVFFNLFALAWSGGFAALVQESVLPRMRGTASALFSLVVTLISAGIGPYMVGKVSTVSGSLTTGLMSVFIVVPIGTVALIVSATRVGRETEQDRLRRAAEAGESMPHQT